MINLNFDYLFYRIFTFFKNSYSFVINIPWERIHFWVQIIAGVVALVFIVGIIRNIVKINNLKVKK